MCGSTLILFQAPAIILGQGSSFASCSVGVFNNLKYRCKPLAYMVFLWVPVNFCHPLARNARESNMSWMKKTQNKPKKKEKKPKPHNQPEESPFCSFWIWLLLFIFPLLVSEETVHNELLFTISMPLGIFIVVYCVHPKTVSFSARRALA